MQNYKKFFKDKKITVMGLGLLGRGLGYTKFLAECGANLIVTDLKTKAQLASSLKELEKYKNIKFTLGRHDLKDFKNRDMVIKAAGVPLNSPYIAETKENKIPVEMDVSLFARLAPDITIVGVTGTRGKSMTTQLIYEILKKNEKLLKRKIYLGGNVRGVATLPLLKKAKPGDILVAELDSWQLQGFGEARISPSVAVFTSFMPDHMNYYRSTGLTESSAMKKYFADKANIFKYQKSGDVLVIRPGMKKLIKKSDVKGKLIIANPRSAVNLKFSVEGEHQRENLAAAVEVAKVFKIPAGKIAKSVKGFKGLEGRLQYVKTVRGVKIYNDNNATTPTATLAGLESLGKSKNIILIIGGNDKKLPLHDLIKIMREKCKKIITIPGTGTDKLKIMLDDAVNTKDLRSAVAEALRSARPGDTVLFSPAFSSFSQFNNEYERGDLFMKIVKGLK